MVIYRARNKQNGKVYVGQTVQTLQRRKTGHRHTARSGRSGYFNNALRKYGFDEFEWKVMCECTSFEDLQIAEEIFIAYYRSNENRYGYNLQSGGLNARHSDRTRKLLSQQKTGRKLPAAWKANVVNAIRRRNKVKYPVNESEVIDLYLNLLSSQAVADKLKTSRKRVAKILRDNNIVLEGQHKPRTEKQMLTSASNGKRRRTPAEREATRLRMRGNSYGVGYSHDAEKRKAISEKLKARVRTKESIDKGKISALRSDGKHANTKRVNADALICDYKSGLTRRELEEKYNANFNTLLLRIKEIKPDLPEEFRRIRMSLCKKKS